LSKAVTVQYCYSTACDLKINNIKIHFSNSVQSAIADKEQTKILIYNYGSKRFIAINNFLILMLRFWCIQLMRRANCGSDTSFAVILAGSKGLLSKVNLLL
jgi:hypothetical protein